MYIMNEMKVFTRKRAAKITNIPTRRIQFYTEQGIMSDVKTKVGKGFARIYSQKNLFELFLIKELHLLGINFATIFEILIRTMDLASTWADDSGVEKGFLDFNANGEFIGNYEDFHHPFYREAGAIETDTTSSGKSISWPVETAKILHDQRRSVVNEKTGEVKDLLPEPEEYRFFLYIFDSGKQVALAVEREDSLDRFNMTNRKTGIVIDLTEIIKAVSNA